jgi:hypothetical protein
MQSWTTLGGFTIPDWLVAKIVGFVRFRPWRCRSYSSRYWFFARANHFHQLEHRIEAHIFVAFMAYCLHVTLRARLRPLAPGLTPRALLDKFAAIQMLDVHFPTTDGRTLILSRYTHPEPDHWLLLEQLNLTLPAQPPPRISSRGKLLNHT